jgi:hypothetical protein
MAPEYPTQMPINSTIAEDRQKINSRFKILGI